MYAVKSGHLEIVKLLLHDEQLQSIETGTVHLEACTKVKCSKYQSLALYSVWGFCTTTEKRKCATPGSPLPAAGLSEGTPFQTEYFGSQQSLPSPRQGTLKALS